MLLVCGTLFAIARCTHSAPLPLASAREEDGLRQENNGTATATGIVVENNQGCRVDASCYLRLRVGSDEIRVIYHPGEGERHINKAAYQQGISAGKGAHVEVYGRYSKRAGVAMIETFSSDKFYIHVLPK